MAMQEAENCGGKVSRSNQSRLHNSIASKSHQLLATEPQIKDQQVTCASESVRCIDKKLQMVESPPQSDKTQTLLNSEKTSLPYPHREHEKVLRQLEQEARTHI